MTGVSIATIMAGCGSGEEGTVDTDDDGDADASDDGNDDQPAVTIHDYEWSEDSLGATLSGTAENTSGEEQSYIEIGVVVFDGDGTRIDDWFTNITDVPAGQEFTWEINLTTGLDEFEDYEIEWSTSAT